MRPLLLVILAVAALAESATAGEQGLAEALRRASVKMEITAASGGDVHLSLTNQTGTEVLVVQPPGLILAASDRDLRVLTLRALRLPLTAHSTVKTTVSIAALSHRGFDSAIAYQPTNEVEPRLTPLLAYLAKNDDVSQLSAQLAVLCLLENLTFTQWQQFLAPRRKVPTTDATLSEVAAAIDTLVLLRTLTPDRKFALAEDGDLRRRSLRNPWSRAKAAQLFGLDTLTIETPAPLPPALGTLLHTKANDNCPICRNRSLLQPGDDGP